MTTDPWDEPWDVHVRRLALRLKQMRSKDPLSRSSRENREYTRTRYELECVLAEVEDDAPEPLTLNEIRAQMDLPPIENIDPIIGKGAI